ncbi:MAG TPA: phosphoadenylyl-sulfate reductase [Stellaceae bacterium]|nr:phosphoadenylyl-sulfate reductase [Stellaceae bacterium]
MRASKHAGQVSAVTRMDETDSTPAIWRAAELAERYADRDGVGLLRPLIEREFVGRLAIVSSFGTESAVILAQVAQIDRDTPILFLDTGKLFSETLRYRDRLVAHLGLRDVRTISADPERLRAADPDGMLWLSDPDFCCTLRKVEPLAPAFVGFDAWVSGRKRYQGGARSTLPVFEVDDGGRIKVNPLANWPRSRVEAEFALRGLPRHPLEAQGYLSIGCITCTDRVHSGEDPRAGRWRDLPKTECGIHVSTRRRSAS